MILYNYSKHHRQIYILNSSCHYDAQKFNAGSVFAYNLFHQCIQASYQLLLTSLSTGLTCAVDSVLIFIQYSSVLRLNSISALLSIKTQISRWLSKLVLVLVLLLLLCSSFNTQALSATTARVINGSEPYLTFDNGVTKVTTSEGLLSITLSNGTKITPTTNTSTVASPIMLPEANQRFTDINMVVPTTTDSIDLNDLVGAPYNYWGDDDGDGQGVNGITATGNVRVSITDRDNQEVSRTTALDVCQAPYKVELTSTSGSLSTQYGVPNSSYFLSARATYYITPKAEPKICYARPNLTNGTNGQESGNWNYSGPVTIWNTKKGYLVQSIDSSTYDRNFPTTGANNLHFDLLAGGIDAATLTWPTVTQGDITATMTVNPPKSTPSRWGYPTFNPDGASSVRITLTGPAATERQMNTDYPTSSSPPSLPQTFEIVGYDSSHTAVLKYGFVLKHWFIRRGPKLISVVRGRDWCSRIDPAYRVPKVKDLTNAVCAGYNASPECENSVGATPASTQNNYQRNIGAGFFTEWGSLYDMRESGIDMAFYWSDDFAFLNNITYFLVHSATGMVKRIYLYDAYLVLCVYP